MKQKRALIPGITGQDGSYLAEILLKQGYHVMGLTRDVSRQFTPNIRHLQGQVELFYCPYSEYNIIEAIQSLKPDEIYNLTGQSYVGKSWNLVYETVQTTGIIPALFLNAIYKINRDIKFFQASSSEIFTPESGQPLTEELPIMPSSPYGCGKALAHQMVVMFRKSHNLFLTNGILFNHESSKRYHDFLSKKVVCAAVAIKLNKQKDLTLGNMQVARDWGFAGDYMDAAYRIMQLDKADDFIIATGETHTVEQLVKIVFDEVGLIWQEHVKTDASLSRPVDVAVVCGSSRKLREATGWKPTVTFENMLREMVADELRVQKNGA